MWLEFVINFHIVKSGSGKGLGERLEQLSSLQWPDVDCGLRNQWKHEDAPCVAWKFFGKYKEPILEASLITATLPFAIVDMEQGANRLLWDHNISPSIIDGCFPWFPVIGGLILPAPEPRDSVIPFPPTFPGNLLHNIFTHLMPNGDNQHDCRDLMNCSLTSRKWHVYAQRILLQHPVVRNPSWLRLLSRARWKLRMKRSPSLNVNLMLKGPPCGKPHLIQAWKSNVDWQEQACYVLSPYVAKTSTLRLDNLQFIRWETFSSKVHRTSINLQKLSLNFCRFSTFEEFEGLIRSFKSLNSLSLDFVSWNSAPPFRRRSCRNVVKLVPRCLRIGRNCDIHTLVDWILETQYWQQLERLEIDEISSSIGERVLEAVSSLQLLSSLAERQLRYLKLGCHFEISPWHGWYTSE